VKLGEVVVEGGVTEFGEIFAFGVGDVERMVRRVRV
jgi:hypothetical protein